MSAQQQVITIDDISADNAPAIYVAGGLGQFFEAVKAEVTGEVPDLTTVKGRARIASLAATVSKSKKAVETPGRDYLKRLKEMPKVVEAELREFVTKMDSLRDATRQPLTEWEDADQARKDKHVDGIQGMKDFLIFEGAPSADQVGHVIAILELVAINDSWEEFLPEAAQAKGETLLKLRTLHTDRIHYEAEQAELVRLRAEAEAQAQRDRDAEIARVAAEQARLQVERQAQAEREAAARREQELLDQAAATQRAAAQAVLDAEAAAERQRLQLELQAEQARAVAAQAETNRIAAEQRAEQDRLAAIRRQEEAVEQARLAEVARANAAADEILRQQQERQADVAHKSKILGEAKQALIGMNISEELAKAIVLKIARGEVPNVSIQF
ncbi:hypothetical protein BOP96_12190 [Pseudomonas sp. FSL W5-0203]|uniref:hypothetical protein n=1 Tax=Pseudomonas sp. FSL W5-0203 TaxID=1920491 RepID=UPI0009377ED3|nr:hypothetical protein [Pseudomonas sp. FSL W5-0203]OJT30207.1 hypothetical protein BOP96_12190 [Pseudomonas sp. FSL W5-0203]